MKKNNKKLIKYTIFAILSLLTFLYSCSKELLIPAIFAIVMFNVFIKELAEVSYNDIEE
jgi:hypothetical protein